MSSSEETGLFIKKIKKYIPNIQECLNAPVKNEKIDELETIIGKILPADFKKLFLSHNGENEKVFGIMASFRWMNIESVISNWKILQHSAYEITSAQDGMIEDGNFKKGWIPFAEDCGGSFLVLDLEPGVRGTHGQIITIDHNSSFSYVVTDSIQMFFNFIEKNFENGNLDTYKEDNVMIINWKQGHLFDDLVSLNIGEINSNFIPVKGFWAEYYKQDVIDGCISTKILAKSKTVFIKGNLPDEFGDISLDILRHMINLKELIIHADNIVDFAPIKNIFSLRKLVIRSKSFKEVNLKSVAKLKELKEVTLVNLTLKDLSSLQNIKALKCLNLVNISTLDCSCMKHFKELKELRLENIECDDLSYLSYLSKLTKLELKEMKIATLSFLRYLKHLTVFETDRAAEDESEISLFGEINNLERLIYPIGDLKVIYNCVKLQAIGIDALRLQRLEFLESLNITDITIFNASSEENAESIVMALKKYCKLRSYGWRQTW